MIELILGIVALLSAVIMAIKFGGSNEKKKHLDTMLEQVLKKRKEQATLNEKISIETINNRKRVKSWLRDIKK